MVNYESNCNGSDLWFQLHLTRNNTGFHSVSKNTLAKRGSLILPMEYKIYKRMNILQLFGNNLSELQLPLPLKYCHCLNRQKYKHKLNSVSLLVATKKNVSNAPQISLRRFIVLRKFTTSQLNESVLQKNHVSKLVIFPSFAPSLLSKFSSFY